MKLSKIKIYISIFFIFFCIFSLKTVVKAESLTSISLSPTAMNPIVGDTIEIKVNIQNVQGLYGASIDFKYDPNSLEIISLEPGNIFDKSKINYSKPINNTSSGDISLYALYLGENITSSSPINSLFTMKVKFKKATTLALKAIADNSSLAVNGNNLRIKLSNSAASKINYNLPNTTTITSKSLSTEVDKNYQRAYDSVINVVEKAKLFGVKPYFDTTNGGPSITDNVLMATKEGLQLYILASRDYIGLLPTSLLTSKQTFSSILDNYQHPIYERIVSVINYAQKNPNQKDVNIARHLIKDVPKAFALSYSSALDEIQINLFNKASTLVAKAETSKSPSDINNAKTTLAELKTIEFITSDIDNFIKGLEIRISAIK